MKFLTEMPQRIFGIELQREFFASRKICCHKSEANVQRAIHPLNPNYQTSGRFDACMNSMIVPSGSRT